MERIKRVANSLEKEIRLLRLRFFGHIIVYLLLIVLAFYLGTRENFIVLDKSGNISSGQVSRRDEPENVFIEADDHLRDFYSTFFTLNHQNIKEQNEKAAWLGGNVVKEAYTNLQAGGFYNNIKTENYFVNSVVDSIPKREFQFDGTGVRLKVYGHMTLKNNVYTEVRNLDATFYLVITQRIPVVNPHGFSIEGISQIENEILTQASN